MHKTPGRRLTPRVPRTQHSSLPPVYLGALDRQPRGRGGQDEIAALLHVVRHENDESQISRKKVSQTVVVRVSSTRKRGVGIRTGSFAAAFSPLQRRQPVTTNGRGGASEAVSCCCCLLRRQSHCKQMYFLTAFWGRCSKIVKCCGPKQDLSAEPLIPFTSFRLACMLEFQEGSMWIGVLIWMMFRHLGRKERSRFLIWVGVGWEKGSRL